MDVVAAWEEEAHGLQRYMNTASDSSNEWSRQLTPILSLDACVCAQVIARFHPGEGRRASAQGRARMKDLGDLSRSAGSVAIALCATEAEI